MPPAAKYKPYPKYKPSGVEWLGDVPEGWICAPIKFITTKIGSGKTPRGGAEVYTKEGITFLRSQNVYNDGVRLDDVVYITEETDQEMKGSRVKENDVLLNITGASLGRCSKVPSRFTKANVNQHVCIIRPAKSKIISDHLHYCIISNSGQDQIFLSEHGSAREGLTFEQIANMYISYPFHLPEQRAIAAFLDRETARIDRLVEKKRRLIDLLREKRTALISEMVTGKRSLVRDPDTGELIAVDAAECASFKKRAPEAVIVDATRTKPSGVEWLGNVPERWEVAPVYSKYEVQLGKMLDSSRIKGDHLAPYLRNIDVQWGQINTENLPEMDFSDSDRKRFTLKKGDLIVCEGGDIGRTAIWESDLFECYYQKALHRLRPHADSESPRFFFYLMHTAADAGVFLAGTNPNTIVHLTAEMLRRYRFPFPMLQVQIAIADFLYKETGKIDCLIAKIETAIAKLTEYRSALISAAVTGKIDVREEV